METLITLKIEAKLSAREIANSFLMLPIERRIPMAERIIKMTTIKDYKFFFKHSITNLTKSKLTSDEIAILLTEIREFEKILNRKHDKLQKEFDK